MADKEGGKVEANLIQFFSGMAVQTLVHLGKMSNPMTGQSAVDLPNAKYSLDLLALFQEKTKGNLTPQENEYLANVLRDLRLEYVAVADKAAQGAAGGGSGAAAAAGEAGKSDAS